MKFFQYLLATAATLGCVNAAPAIDSMSLEVAKLQPRTFWWFGTSKLYKFKAYCPGKQVHGKYMSKHPETGNLGFWGKDDFQFYFDSGYWGNSWGGHPGGSPSWDVCMQGPSGWKDMCPKNSPGKNDPWKDNGGGGPGYPPSKWGTWGGLWIEPFFPSLEIFDIFGIFSSKHWVKWHWWQNNDGGYDWICYPDEGGKGWHVKHWDHKYALDQKILKIYFVLKIEAVKKSWW